MSIWGADVCDHGCGYGGDYGNADWDAERQRERGDLAGGLSVTDRPNSERHADDDADGDERHHHGGRGRQTWRQRQRHGDAERDGGGDQHGAGEPASYTGNSGFHGTDTLTATTTDGAAAALGRRGRDHGCGHGGDFGNADGTLSGSENAAISLAGISVTDRPNSERHADDDADGDERHHHGGRGGRLAQRQRTVTLSGTAAAINAALASASYTGNSGFHGSDT